MRTLERERVVTGEKGRATKRVVESLNLRENKCYIVDCFNSKVMHHQWQIRVLLYLISVIE